MGRAKFGVFGDGKELAQLAMAQVFCRGDFRSGYYRDQTFVLALGEVSLQQFFAQIYAHTDLDAEPSSAGRMMNSHFGSRLVGADGEPINQKKNYNSASDISPTAGQIPRALGFAYASKLYRHNPALADLTDYSQRGNEVTFATIGDASTSEGMFFEAINAAGVLQVPLVFSVWDDGYGISVPKEYHTTKMSISEALMGFQRTEDAPGLEIFTVKGWDYEALCSTYREAARVAREAHVPVLVHVEEVTQPQGHSTSGSHERYKSKQRLVWEKEHDCNVRFRDWILQNGFASAEQLDEIEQQALKTAREAKNRAWKAFRADIDQELQQVLPLLEAVANASGAASEVKRTAERLRKKTGAIRLDIVRAVKQTLRLTRSETTQARRQLRHWLSDYAQEMRRRYNTQLYNETDTSALRVETVPPNYEPDAKKVDGREVLNACFDAAFAREPRLFAIGEDIGKIGDVNQGFAGLQKKYGELRITDTGIRETTIIGQGIGSAIRGLRPIVEVQYLDYIYYTLATLTDDLASLSYRTMGGQRAPLIVRTRGHRLEGVWHSGSPIGTLIHSLRGMHLLVPRNMTQASGFYNTLLQSEDPALVIECLNAYRLKEEVPANIGEFTVPLGQPEVLRAGEDVTIVTYGAMCRIVMAAAEQLAQEGISCEVIDVQTLLPFDLNHRIAASVAKTNRVVFADEDVPGGASAYMMQQVLEKQDAYHHLDSAPVTIAAAPHRPPYGSDGDYFSKPNAETVFDRVYALMAEFDPEKFVDIY